MNMMSIRHPNLELGFDNQPYLATARLDLRKVVEADIVSVQSALSRYEVARMLVAVPQPFDRIDAKQIVDRWSQATVPGWGFGLSLTDDANKTLIGLLWIRWRDEKWRLGMWLVPEYWGQGIMSEALNIVLQAFFRNCMGATISAGVIADNPASLRVQQKLGFEIVGTSQAFCLSRNEMVDVIETELTFGGFMPL